MREHHDGILCKPTLQSHVLTDTPAPARAVQVVPCAPDDAKVVDMRDVGEVESPRSQGRRHQQRHLSTLST